MAERRTPTEHKVGSDKGELKVVLRTNDGFPGIQMSNWQSVRSDEHGVYVLFAQISALGVNLAEQTADADVISEVYVPRAILPGLLKALNNHADSPAAQTPDEQQSVDNDGEAS